MEKAGLRGVILVAGKGTRLRPLTCITSKALLPVYDRPMIMHPIDTLMGIGVRDICIVTNPQHLPDFRKVLGSGARIGIRIRYAIQTRQHGIAHALLQAKGRSDGAGKIVAVLGDNLFGGVQMPKGALNDDNAYVFLKRVRDPRSFGVATIDREGNIVGIEEKPARPKSDMAVTGLYVYPSDVFRVIKELRPSARGEVEITALNNRYLIEGRLRAVLLEGRWMDAGTFDSLLAASIMRARDVGGRGYISFLDKE